MELLAWLIGLIVVSTPATIFAASRYKRAQAEIIWAQRCDPKGTFRGPLFGKRR
jgi:hypothetical protein